MKPKTPQDLAKYAAGKEAVKLYAKPGARLGLGSGTTSAWFVRALGEEVARGLKVSGVPTSTFTRDLALSLKIPLIDLNDLDIPLDVTIDGPDEIDPDGDMIKGGGACLLWERMVACASKTMVCIADETKLVPSLGNFPLPIEVVQYGWKATADGILTLLIDLGYPDVTLLRRCADNQPIVTDSGNFILDASLGLIEKKQILDTSLLWIPGVVDHGLFVGVADRVIFGSENQSTRTVDLRRSRSSRSLPTQ